MQMPFFVVFFVINQRFPCFKGHILSYTLGTVMGNYGLPGEVGYNVGTLTTSTYFKYIALVVVANSIK